LFVIKAIHKIDYPKQEQKWRSGQLEGYAKTGIFSKQLSGDKRTLADRNLPGLFLAYMPACPFWHPQPFMRFI
jgi:hypothetical protein